MFFRKYIQKLEKLEYNMYFMKFLSEKFPEIKLHLRKIGINMYFGNKIFKISCTVRSDKKIEVNQKGVIYSSLLSINIYVMELI